MAVPTTAPTSWRALVAPLMGCIALCGCTTTVHDLAVKSVSLTDSAEWIPRVSRKEQTNRLLLRVDLTTQANLREALSRWNMLIHANVVFCDHPDDYVPLGLSLYTATPGGGALPHTLNSGWSAEPSGTLERTYYLLLNTAMPPYPTITRPGTLRSAARSRGHMHFAAG